MTSTEQPFSFRSIALAAFLPTVLFSIGEGAIIPIIPVVASNLGAGLALAGFVGAMIMVGEVLGDIPSGWVVGRIGERNAMIWASLLCIVGLTVCLVSPTTLALTIGVFLIGIATSVFALARHAFMTGYVPLKYRARALSTLGGTFRAGWFVGPFIAAGMINLFGDAHVVFWIHIVACVSAAVVLFVVPDPSEIVDAAPRAARAGSASGATASSATSAVKPPLASEPALAEVADERRDESLAGSAPAPRPGRVGRLLRPKGQGRDEAAARTAGLFPTIWQNRGVLARMGLGAALIGGLRSSRTIILPLFAVAIGMSAPSTALVIGIAGAVDFFLFYTSGQIMDRFGRMWSAIPSMVGLGIAHLALAFVTHEPLFVAVAIFMSLANGVGSGILMTLGADLAPAGGTAAFLGAWRFTGDVGQAGAPLLVSLLTALVSLPVASAAMGVLGLVGAGLLVRWIPRYIPKRARSPKTAKA